MPTVTGIPVAAVEDAVQIACRAPSYHNSQPWRWVCSGGALHLFVDTDRLVATDHAGRQALISCGAALHHVRVALASSGSTVTVDYVPDPTDARHVATVRWTMHGDAAPVDLRLADAIVARRTDRLPLAAPPDWPALEAALRSAVGDLALVDTVADDDLPMLVEASALTESLRLYDSAYHAEMSWWTAPFEVSDGIPRSALVSAAESDRVAIGRTFPVISHRERRPQIGEDRAAVLVLSVADDTREALLACGEALSAVLLEATAAGLSTGTLSHLTEIEASRDVVRTLTGRRHPQVLVRIGLAPVLDDVPPPTPRRPLADVLVFAPQ